MYPPEPAPEGTVLSVRERDTGPSVEITMGSNVGVRVGDGFHIARGDRYMGRIEITEVRPDSSTARCTGWFWRLPPQKGDRVFSPQ